MKLPHDQDKKNGHDHCAKQAGGWNYESYIESEPNNCAKVIETLLTQLETYQWCNRDTFGIHMAMEEAVMNAIRHGNQCDPEKQVHIVMQICEKQFYSKITDQGVGFDPTNVPDPTLEENLDKTCGRGVMLMKNFVDRVEYNAKGNSVELEKTKSAKSK